MTDTIAKKIGNEIKVARERNNLTQQQLSKKINISRNYLSDIECGRYIPSTEKLLVLARILDIDLNLLKMTEIEYRRC
ncbi:MULTISPECIES: helix-turn-helix transcriptional regulator [unclassified Clostridium]|uniref:helix-turn-helix transcriptional regulator n=1 Tax=unclassified Clostridium TaxID=2614128 RepID=UPI00321726ED